MIRVANTWVRNLRSVLLCFVMVACSASDDPEELGSTQSKIDVGQALVLRQLYAPFGPGPLTYSRGYIEIYNRGSASASLSGLSLQAPSLDPFNPGAFMALTLLPSVSLAPGQSYLVASRAGSAGADLPSVPDLVVPVVPGNIAPGYKVALVRSTTSLACGGTVTCSSTQLNRIVDLVGFGTGDATLPYETVGVAGTAPAPLPSGSTALLRKVNGTQDTNNNSADFVLGTPQPRNMDSWQVPVPNAPALPTNTTTPPGDLNQFIYSGCSPNCAQTGVTTTIDAPKSTWVVGYVKDGAGAALSGATVTVVGQSGYGQSMTRADGRFDMVVNGGTTYTLRFHKTGYFDADRRVYAPWQQTAGVEDVYLVTADTKATVVTTAPGGSVQVASANAVQDALGSRTAVLLLPKQTKVVTPGQTTPTSLTLRLTEYTVGPNGRNRMPAPLDGAPAYTYAVEISADQAGPGGVLFQNAAGTAAKDVYTYVEDFLNFGALARGSGFGIGGYVPTGYYDRAAATWKAGKSGRIIKVTVPTSGPATADVDTVVGDDNAATLATIGMDADELTALANQYRGTQPVTKTLWRVPIDHLTPWDCNWPAVPPGCQGSACPKEDGKIGTTPPSGCPGKCCGGGAPPGGSPGAAAGENFQKGSIIGCDSQILGESFKVAGTDYTLNYRSDRVPGHSAKRSIKIDLTGGGPLHTEHVLIAVDVAIAGQLHHREFVPTPNLSWTFVWDGLDAAQRPVVGTATAAVRIDNYYRGAYVPSEIFGQYPSPTALRASSPRIYKQYTRTLQALLTGRAPEGAWTLGGWTLNKHHLLDPQTNTVYFGSGESQSAGLQGGTITRILGDGSSSGFAPDDTSATAAGTGLPSGQWHGVAATPNGDVLVANGSSVIRRIDATGKIKTIAGTGQNVCTTPPPPPGDNETDATTARLDGPTAMAVAPDGSIYIALRIEHTVRKLRPLATGKYAISTVTGGNYRCISPTGFGGDGGPASAARVASPQGVAVGPDGSVYIADTGNRVVRRIDPSGMMSTVAGNGNSFPKTEGLATSVAISATDVAVGPDGTLYIIGKSYELLKVDKNGMLTRVTKSFDGTPVIEGVPISTQVVDGFGESVTTSPDGSVFFNDFDWQRTPPIPLNNARRFIRGVDTLGVVRSIASSPNNNQNMPTRPAVGAALGDALAQAHALAIAPNGDVLTAEANAIYRIQRAPPLGASICVDTFAKYFVPSGDEGYCFDERGRHLKTIDRLTGQTRYSFNYSTNLASVTGPDGRVMAVTFPTTSTIVLTAPPPAGSAPPGVQTTTITKSTTTGWATAITDAIGGLALTPNSSGLLQTLKDGENNSFNFVYDNDGFLLSDASPLGIQTLARSTITDGRRVTHTAPGTRVTTYDSTRSAAGILTHTTTYPDYTTRIRVSNPNGVETETSRDGVLTTTTFEANAVYGTQMPVASLQTIKLPSGLTRTIKRTNSGPSGSTETSTTIYDDTVTPAVQETVTRAYSAAGQTITTTSPAGRTTTTQLDAVGRLTSIQSGNATAGTLTPITFLYANGQLASRTQGGRVTTYTYQADKAQVDAGMLLRMQDNLSTTELRHDARGRVTSSEAALATTVAAKTQSTWWKHDVLKTLTTPATKQHAFFYDQVKHLQQYVPPTTPDVSSPATTYGYTNGLLTSETRPGLAAITGSYVATGQLNVIALPATSLSGLAGYINHDYYSTTNASTGAAAGRLSRISIPASMTLDYKYDGSLLTSQKWTDNGVFIGEVDRSYNNRFLASWERVRDRNLITVDNFGYDNDGLLTCVSPSNCNPPATDALRLTRSPIHGKVTSITAGSTTETVTYSDTAADRTANTAFGELRQQTVTVGGTTVATIIYDQPTAAMAGPRDARGRIRYKWDTFRNATSPYANVTTKWEYQYNQRGELKTVLMNGAQVGAIQYDLNGNPTQTNTTTGSSATTWTADDQDRLTGLSGATSATFTYYANGELKTKSGTTGNFTYHYDALGRLRAVVPASGQTIEYILDGEGRRVAKKKGGTIVRRWLYRDGLSPIAELDGSGALVARFVYGSRKNIPDRIIRGSIRGSTSYRLISDHLGSPRYAVNEANINDVKYQVVWSVSGVPTVGGGLDTATTLDWIPFGFAGGLYDRDTGLIHFGARDYDPSIGRWVSKDPIRFRGGINLYMYSWNDPVNFRDPTGRDPVGAGGASNSGEGGGEGASSDTGNGEALMCGGEDGYGDFNITGGAYGLGATGGYFFDANGEIHFYAGGGAVSPGVSVGFSNSIWGSPSPGQWSAQVQGSVGGVTGAYGTDMSGSTFLEYGYSFPPTPSGSATLYYTW